MTEAMVDDALVEKVARAMVAWRYPRLTDAERDEMWDAWVGDAQSAIAIAYPAGVAAGREEAAKVVETWDKIGWSRMDLIDLRIHLATAIRQRGK